LDGEFAIILVDYKSRCVYLSTDIFLTKPLYVSFDNDGYFGVASYSSALTYAGFHDVNKLEANTIYKIDLDRPRLEKIGSVYAFSLRQYREDFDGWIEAFELAVKKRFLGCREKIFIGLSSGYDSGAICCALNKMGQPYNTYSVLGKENLDILNSRVALLPKGSIHRFIIPTHEVRERARNYINQYVEELNYVTYTSVGDYNEFNLKLHDDSGSTGLSMVCESAILDRCKVYLSGQGADEIISDYGFNGIRIYPHSNFGGLFPTDLESVFPWPSFYNSSQASYLMKEEHVAGSYGIEARYPFLDKRVVQEFLCLHPSLKNSTYKAPIRAYLEKNNFPTLFDHKIGF
jgi:asparagine synthetase B (glutamine-hydrolysing)